jgi:NADH dehydrogenase [ubiquinone] 1 alpha subcomplex assembly factor 6
MQWWRDALHEIYDNSEVASTSSTNTSIAKRNATDPILSSLSVASWHSPVVRALDVANRECNLTRRFLERLIDVRESDLDVNQYKTMADAVAYSEESASSLLYLSLECTGVRDDEADIVASHAGIGIGLVTALRSTPYRVQHGEVPIPAELLHNTLLATNCWTIPKDEQSLSVKDADMFPQAVQIMAEAAGWLKPVNYRVRSPSMREPVSARDSYVTVLSKLQGISNFDTNCKYPSRGR